MLTGVLNSVLPPCSLQSLLETGMRRSKAENKIEKTLTCFDRINKSEGRQ